MSQKLRRGKKVQNPNRNILLTSQGHGQWEVIACEIQLLRPLLV